MAGKPDGAIEFAMGEWRQLAKALVATVLFCQGCGGQGVKECDDCGAWLNGSEDGERPSAEGE